MADDDGSIIWVGPGLASRILGVCSQTLISKYAGSIVHIRLQSGQIRLSLESVQALAKELRR